MDQDVDGTTWLDLGRSLRRYAAPMALVGCLVAGVVTGAPHAAASPQREVSVAALGQRLGQWVADTDPAQHRRAVERVQQGVPPAALAAFLAATRKHPDAQYEPLLARAARYRSVNVRGQALAALAAHGARQAASAIVSAADDHDRTIRRLAWALSKLHPSPSSHEVVAKMLARDPELAEEIALLEAPEPEDEIIVFDESEPAATEPSP